MTWLIEFNIPVKRILIFRKDYVSKLSTKHRRKLKLAIRRKVR